MARSRHPIGFAILLLFAVVVGVLAGVRFGCGHHESVADPFQVRLVLAASDEIEVLHRGKGSDPNDDVAVCAIDRSDSRFDEVLDMFNTAILSGENQSPKAPHLAGGLKFVLKNKGGTPLVATLRMDAVQIGDEFYHFEKHLQIEELFKSELEKCLRVTSASTQSAP